jgi:hypothetical protein
MLNYKLYKKKLKIKERESTIKKMWGINFIKILQQLTVKNKNLIRKIQYKVSNNF